MPVEEDQGPLLLLPPEILLEIFHYFDHHALIAARRTCKVLCDMMNSKLFWADLARGLCYKPGIGELKYPIGNYSTIELMHWTLRRLNTREQYISNDPSQPFQFRSRLVDGGQELHRAELLRGGKWLLTLQGDDNAHILDLEKEPPQSQFLFRVYSRDIDLLIPFTRFQIWVDETKHELSFRILIRGWRPRSEHQMYIHQIDCGGEDSAFVVTPISVIRDYSHRDLRFSAALSDKFFVQCFTLRDENGQKIGPESTIVLHLHRYSQNVSCNYNDYVEEYVTSNKPVSVSFLPGDRAGFAAPTFINIYTISYGQDHAPLQLTLLHHIPVRQAPHLLSAPFIGSQCTYLVGVYKGTFRRITFPHNCDLPPAAQDIGSFHSFYRQAPNFVKFGPSATLVLRSNISLGIVAYEDRADGIHFQPKYYNFPAEFPLRILNLVAFDDSVGRIVAETNADRGQLMVLDLI